MKQLIASPLRALTLIVTAGRVAVLIYGGYLVLNHGCTVGDFVLFIALQDMVYVPISQISIIDIFYLHILTRTADFAPNPIILLCKLAVHYAILEILNAACG